MKELSKIVSVVGILALMSFTSLLGFGLLSEGKNIFNPYIDTIFGSDYSPSKFGQIRKGMTIEEVIKIVGQPLKISKLEKKPFIKYIYTNDGKFKKNLGRKEKLISDFAWYRSSVIFGTNDIVIEIDQGWSFD